MTPSPLQALKDHAGSNPDGIAFFSGADTWRYKRLFEESERLAHGLVAQGIKQGDRVILHMLNRPEMILAYFGCFHIGAIVTPLRTAYKFAELKPILERLQPSLYIGQPDLYREVEALDPAILPADKRFTVTGTVDAAGTKTWASLLENDATNALLSPDVNAPAVIISTSGTTGTPKLVIHSQATLAAGSETRVRDLEGHNHIGVMPVPMAHASGFSTTLAFIRSGVPFVLLPSFDPDAVLDAIERYRCTYLFGMPAAAASLMERQKARPRKVDSLRLSSTGGDVCPLSLQKEFPSVFGTPLRSVWGTTEASGSLTYGLEHGPVCRIAEGAEVRLVDEAGLPVAQGEVGELEIRGPNVSPGYWGGPGKVEGAPKDGWYRTGDLMRQDAKGDLWFVSRKKDIIIRGGTNISPVEVEHTLLAAHPAIKDAAVVGVPDEVLGERVFGFVQLEPNAQNVKLADILASVKSQLADYKVPEQLKIIDKIPRNALGKIDRGILGSMIQQKNNGSAA